MVRTLPALVLGLACPALAQTLVLPDNCNLAGPTITTSTWRSTAGRFQVAYDSTNFTNAGAVGPVLITQLQFRARDGQPDAGGQTYAVTSVEVGECVFDHQVMSTTFAANRGTMGTAGSMSVVVTPASGSVPNDHVISIDLSTIGATFLYDPTLGNDLLIDISYSAPVPATNLVTLAAGSGTVGTARGRMCTTSTSGSATGSLLAPPVIQVVFAGAGGYPAMLPARLERFGHCCGATFRSFYQDFQISEPFDLSNTSLTMTPDNVAAPNWYTITAGVTPPDLTKLDAVPDSVADNALVAHPLGFSFAYVSGSTNTIQASTEGYVWLDAAMTTIDVTPSVAELLGISVAQTARLAPFWFAFHPGRNTATHPNAGLHVVTDTSGGPGNAVVYVTWHKVGLNMQTAVAGVSVSDLQCVLHEATGVIEYRYGAVPVGPGTLGIVGFSPGRVGGVASAHPGPRDLSSEVPFTTGPDSGAAALSHGTIGQARPAIGTSITLQSYNQPAGAVLGLLLLDLAATTPSLHVPGLMAPGCGISVSPTFLISEVAVAPTGTWSAAPLAIQPSWLGLQFFSQYATADANLVFSTSNALRHTVGLN